MNKLKSIFFIGIGSVYKPQRTQLEEIHEFVGREGARCDLIVIVNNTGTGITIAKGLKDLGFTHKTCIFWNSEPSAREKQPYEDQDLAALFAGRSSMKDYAAMI